MIKESYPSPHSPAPWSNHKRYPREVKKTLFFSVPINTARERLKSAFSSTISFPGNFFLAEKEFTGFFSNDQLEVQFIDQSEMVWYMQGQLISLPQGSGLEMRIKSEYSLLLFIPVMLLLSFISMGESLSSLVFPGIFFGAFIYGMESIHYSQATSDISTLLLKIVHNFPLRS